jgi:sigma-E factor negative regulatory protein RseC
MLEETAQVVHVEGNQFWVETERRSTCSSCSAQAGCGTAVLSRVLGTRRNRVRVLSDLPLRVGDRVVIGVHEQALVRGSLAVYAVPIVLMLLGALVGELGARQFLWQSAEAASTLLGIAGLAGGLWWLRRFTRRIQSDENYQPLVLRRASAVLEMNAIK